MINQTSVEAEPIRCSSCRRIFAFADNANAKRNKIYCSIECMYETPATEFEDRNGMWREAVRSGVSPVRVARLWGTAHSLVYRTVDKG